MESIDKTEEWTKVVFHATDAVKVTSTAGDGGQIRGIRRLRRDEQLPIGSQIVENGWNHEHCELCNTHIHPGDYAYVNVDNVWVCVSCFEK